MLLSALRDSLDLVPTDDLLTVLSSRFKASVFAGLEHDDPDSDMAGTDCATYRYFGGSIINIGLAVMLLEFLRQCRQTVQDEEEVEDG